MTGRRGGRGRGRGRGGNTNGQPLQQNPVEFFLYASESFDMAGCPAITKPATDPQARARLLMPERELLGDIVLWFTGAAASEPSAILCVRQATRQEKNWLCGFVEQSVPALEVGEMQLGPTQKYMQLTLKGAYTQPPPPPPRAPQPEAHAAAAPAVSSNGTAAPAAGDKQPATATSATPGTNTGKNASAEAVQQMTKEAASKLTAAGKAAQEAVASAEQQATKAVGAAAAAAGKAAKETADVVGKHAASAAAAVKDGLCDARHQLHGAADVASDKARTWMDAVQTDNRTQMVVAGAATTLLAVVGIVAGVLLGRRRKA